MSPNKRKQVTESTIDETDNIKQQYNSLQVNLSYALTSTDSGNDSLKQMAVDNNVNTTSNTMNINTLLKDTYRCSKNKQVSMDKKHKSYHDVPLKNVSIVLKKINNDDEILNKSCEKLKQAILTKTKQMFDIQNELSVKTHTILNVKCLKDQDKINDANQSIASTPKDKYEDSLNEQKKQYRLRKKRLFNINNSKCNFSKLNENHNHSIMQCNSSIVLAGSNKKCNTLHLSNTPCKLIDSDETEDHRVNHSVALEDEIEFTAVPIGCSTMINDEISDTDNEINSHIANCQSSLEKHTKKNTISMEVTDVHEGLMIYDDQNIETATENSANMVQTSLNVNTSIDVLNKNERYKGKDKQKMFKKKGCNKNFQNNENKGNPIVSEKSEGSINTTHTSLQMNTSLDTSNKLCLQRSNNRSKISMLYGSINKKDERENDTATIKDISLTEKFKNVFIQSKIKDNKSDDQNIKSTEVSTKNDQVSGTVTKNKKFVDKINDGQSYIEATPYPTCRSVLLKSQLKQNAVANFLIDTNIYSDKHKSMECTNSGNELKKIVSETIILDTSSSCVTYNEKSKTSVIINESTDESKLEKDQNIENSFKSSPKRRCKKKLLPLCECSQLLTFSPMEEAYLPPKNPTFIKRRKKGKKQSLKKCNTKSSACNKEQTEEESIEQTLLENHLHTFRDKTGQNIKKSRKVISKKIVIKKFVNEDILKQLEEKRKNINRIQMEASASARNSTDDFQSQKRLSTTQLLRKKTQRINIVATGLSNDDKSMVRSVIKALGYAKIESNVTKRTTHVVTTGVRTINLLHGIIRGCWLVNLEWILKSLESNAWLNPEKYEIKHFSKAVLENRKDRQLFGKAYVPELFTASGHIYIGKDTTPPCNILKDLIKAAGGFITENPEIAKIIIGAGGLKETWVLDCITTGELQSCNQYEQR